MTLSEARRWQHSPDPEVRAAAERRLGARSASRARTAPRRKAGQAAKTEKRLTRKEQRAAVYAEVDRRAAGICECLANVPGPWEPEGEPMEHDHFWGRGKAPETTETVWLLCSDCHRQKTRNQPSRLDWIESFRTHCKRHGYTSQVAKCDAAIALEAAQHPARASSVRRAPEEV